MNLRTPLIASALLAASFISGTAHAALQGRDLNGSIDSFEAYYDADLDITWLANANMNGLMTLPEANTWAANLSFTDGVHVYDNWRLPTTLYPDASCGYQSGSHSYGYGCTGSEMGHLFYSELGGTAGQSILTSADPDVAKFTNLMHSRFWSGTEYAPNIGGGWSFHFYGGFQDTGYENYRFYALAVSPGDVGIAAIPEPETYAMMLAGLGLVGFMTRRRKLAKV